MPVRKRFRIEEAIAGDMPMPLEIDAEMSSLHREIVSFDGRVLITRFIEKDAATRYGNMVYVRCAPRA